MQHECVECKRVFEAPGQARLCSDECRKARDLARKSTPEAKARRRAYEKTAETKARRCAERQLPKYKAYNRAYQHTERRKAYMAVYRRQAYVADRLVSMAAMVDVLRQGLAQEALCSG